MLPVGLDVADAQSVRTAAAMLTEDPGRLDIFINNAAAYVDWDGKMASTADMDAARTVMEVNLFGAWRMTNALLPLLRRNEHPRRTHFQRRGESRRRTIRASQAGGAAAAYGISKAALNTLTGTQAAEFADTPIIVNAVCPPDSHLPRCRGDGCPTGG